MRSVNELLRLNGRTALVTGAAGHLGEIICDVLAECGAAVVLLDLDGDSCERRAAQLASDRQIPTWAIPVDLRDEGAIRSVPESILERFGGLHILVNNAALVGTAEMQGWATALPEQRSDTWRLAIEVNLTAAFLLTQACAEVLAASSCGSVINIASIYGMVGPNPDLYIGTDMGNPAAYAASKGGLLQLTRWFATTLSPHVRVNAISLGGLHRAQPDQFVQRYEALTPLRRMGKEEDCKGAIAYLASDLSSYVTGHNLVVDGGWTAW